MTIRTLVVDAAAMSRDGLVAMMSGSGDVEVIGGCATVAEARERIPVDWPDVLVVDGTGQMLGSVHEVQAVLERHPRLGIVMLYGNDVVTEPMIEPRHCCANSVLSTQRAGRDELLRAIRCAHTSRVRACEVLCEKSKSETLTWCGARVWKLLSRRERDVLRYVVEGRSSTEIATLVALSPKSVQTYRTRVMRKLGVRDFPGLVQYAVRYGLVTVR